MVGIILVACLVGGWGRGLLVGLYSIVLLVVGRHS